MHARQIALKCMTLVNLEALSAKIFRKRDAAAIKRSRCLLASSRTQLQAFALDPHRRGNDPSTVLQCASAGDLVVNILATRLHVLCRNGSDE